MALVVVAMLAPLVACTDRRLNCDGSGPCTDDPPYQYAVTSVSLASTDQEARAMGFDLNRDGISDNQLGRALAANADVLDIPGLVASGVSDGRYIILGQVIAADLTNGGSHGDGVIFQLLRGGYPSTEHGRPSFAAYECCGHPYVDTSISDGTISGGPEILTLPLYFGTDPFITLMYDAYVEGGPVSEETIGSLRVGGSLSLAVVQQQVLPALRAQLPPGRTLDESLFVSDVPGVHDEAMSFALTLELTRAEFEIEFHDNTLLE
ncbi:MAG TPA: hypothetical protein VGM39_20840 [Kofleriaceae bacterium]